MVTLLSRFIRWVAVVSSSALRAASPASWGCLHRWAESDDGQMIRLAVDRTEFAWGGVSAASLKDTTASPTLDPDTPGCLPSSRESGGLACQLTTASYLAFVAAWLPSYQVAAATVSILGVIATAIDDALTLQGAVRVYSSTCTALRWVASTASAGGLPSLLGTTRLVIGSLRVEALKLRSLCCDPLGLSSVVGGAEALLNLTLTPVMLASAVVVDAVDSLCSSLHARLATVLRSVAVFVISISAATADACVGLDRAEAYGYDLGFASAVVMSSE